MKLLAQNAWLEEASDIVRSGGVVGLAYERLFGLAANALDEAAVHKICAIKNRAGNHPISVILPSRAHANDVAEYLGDTFAVLADRYWPGPLTLLVKARSSIPAPLIGPLGLIGVRMAGPSNADALSKATGLILTATSANLTGTPDARSHRDLLNLESVDAIVEGEVLGPPGSTIVNCTGDEPTVLRCGCIDIGR